MAAERNKGRACLPRTRSEEVGGETRQTDTSAKCHLPVCGPILTPEHAGGKATGKNSGKNKTVAIEEKKTTEEPQSQFFLNNQNT